MSSTTTTTTTTITTTELNISEQAKNSAFPASDWQVTPPEADDCSVEVRRYERTELV